MKDDQIYLRHILDAIGKIEGYVRVGHDEFAGTPHWHDATIRELEIIGEAVKNLSPEVRQKHPEIPWRRIAGLRDVLIHNYMGVDLEAVWGITQQHLPILKDQVMALLAAPQAGGSETPP